MSFILDALKKSENERQRTMGPSLADAPVRRYQSERPWWVIAVGALLIVNLAVLIIVLSRDDGGEAPAPATVAAPAPAATTPPTQSAPVAATPTAPVREGNPAVRSLAEEAGATEDPYYESPETSAPGTAGPRYPDLSAAATVPSGPPMVRPVEPPSVAPLDRSQLTSDMRAGQSAAANQEVLPTATALAATGTSLPDMRLDIHVYSNNPTERFVFINMRKYLEGQVLSEGPTLERITPDGAILNSQGLRFLLPRQ